MSANHIPGPLKESPLVSSWLAFPEDRVVKLRSGRVELGQGNATALVQITADELDVQPQQIAFVAGDTRETPDEGFTSSSHSISVGGMCVRLAASAARRLYLLEATKLLQAKDEELSIVDGVIHRNGKATDLTFWSMADQIDLAVPAADHADPKPSSKRTIAGQSLSRLDLPTRVKGAAFVHDLELPGMLHGRPVHPPSVRSKLKSLDIAALKARPGVIDVVRDGSFVGVIAQREEDAVAASRWALDSAKWDLPDDAPDDFRGAMAASIEETEIVKQCGDVDATQGRMVETMVSRPYIAHATIGPSCAVAQWTGRRLIIWSHTQGVFPLRSALAEVFGLDPNAIDVIHVPGAGCYGHNGADDVALDAALLARALPDRPIRVVWSRADELGNAPLGPGMVTRASAILDDNNRIAAMRVTANSAPHGNRPGRNGSPNLRAAAYLEKPFPVPRSGDIPVANGGGTDRNSAPLYAIPNQEIIKRVVHNLPYRTSSMRGLGAFTNVFALETLMDDIAHEIGIDALRLRLDHLDDARARYVIEEASKAAAWPGDGADGVGYGLGFAQYKNTAAYCAVVVRAEVDDAVRLTHAWACVDTGEVINPDGVINQIEGGIVQSASWGLKEAVGFAGDAVSTLDWETYPILKFSEVPEIAVTLAEQPDEPPLGCAEAAQGPTVAAIGNAVRNALGVRVRDLPLSRDAIVSALA